MITCAYCGQIVNRPPYYLYCSNQCQIDKQYTNYIARWKAGLTTGKRGIKTQNIAAYVARYLREKYGDACSLCGWNKANIKTGKVPLEIDHIDGDSENNSEHNLRLLCPHCHALTPSFRNLNKGKGRRWRRERYNNTTQ